MESDKHVTKNKKKTKIPKGIILDACNVFPTIWIRRIVQADNGAKWIILDSRRYLLWNFRILLWVLYIAFQAIKEI
jgi:hypothetical protein